MMITEKDNIPITRRNLVHFYYLQIHFITLNSSELKKSIIAHCLVWQTKLGELLRKITEYDIDEVYAYVEKSSEEAMKVNIEMFIGILICKYTQYFLLNKYFI